MEDYETQSKKLGFYICWFVILSHMLLLNVSLMTIITSYDVTGGTSGVRY